ncbi:MAG: hypothetical protein P8N28_02950 [Phycisphaerales bacterium]|nr:hypothetical protein [Phycisphaerales bacterium]
MRSICLSTILSLTWGCASSKQADEPGLCDGSGEPTVQIGTGAGSEFYPLNEGDSVSLDVAPQGGFGVSVRAVTTGLKGDDVVDVNLITELNGVQSGEFLSEGVQLYCQEDGNGMLWGVVVGFDPATFPDNDALLALDGSTADLIVEIMDTDGDTATGRVAVTIEVGG